MGDRLPPDVDRGRLARFVLTVMEGGVLQARGRASIEPFDEAVAELRAHFERLFAEAESHRGRDGASSP